MPGSCVHRITICRNVWASTGDAVGRAGKRDENRAAGMRASVVAVSIGQVAGNDGRVVFVERVAQGELRFRELFRPPALTSFPGATWTIWLDA